MRGDRLRAAPDRAARLSRSTTARSNAPGSTTGTPCGVVVHPSLDAFLAAFPAERCWWIETTGAVPYARAPFARGDALVFGKETGALPQALLDAHRARTLRIPMRGTAVRSINLSTAAGIVTYAALAALDFPGLT